MALQSWHRDVPMRQLKGGKITCNTAGTFSEKDVRSTYGVCSLIETTLCGIPR